MRPTIFLIAFRPMWHSIGSTHFETGFMFNGTFQPKAAIIGFLFSTYSK